MGSLWVTVKIMEKQGRGNGVEGSGVAWCGVGGGVFVEARRAYVYFAESQRLCHSIASVFPGGIMINSLSYQFLWEKLNMGWGVERLCVCVLVCLCVCVCMRSSLMSC